MKAQEWLDVFLPSEREKIKSLLICDSSLINDEVHLAVYGNTEMKYYIYYNDSLTGRLDLSSLTNLKRLVIEKLNIKELILTDCELLEEITAKNNLLELIELPKEAENLESVNLVNNNFEKQSLFCFSKFLKLRFLYLGTDDRERINNNIYNRWNGSLIHLNELDDLEELDINATDINDGLVFLPTEKLVSFTFGKKGRKDAKVEMIKKILLLDEEQAVSEDLDENNQKIEIISSWQRKRENINIWFSVNNDMNIIEN